MLIVPGKAYRKPEQNRQKKKKKNLEAYVRERRRGI